MYDADFCLGGKFCFDCRVCSFHVYGSKRSGRKIGSV